MSLGGGSSEELRIIGQDLEALDLRDFRVEWADGVYHVTGTALMAPSEEPEPEGGLARLWRSFSKGGVITDQPRPVELDRTYGPEDLEEVRDRFVDKRSQRPARAAPDSYSPSQMLRVVGAFVDGKKGKFRVFSRRGRFVRIEFEDPSGKLQTEEQPFADLLDFSHYMYRQRADR